MWHAERSEEHTSELQSLRRISYAVFCLKKKKNRVPDLFRRVPRVRCHRTEPRDIPTLLPVRGFAPVGESICEAGCVFFFNDPAPTEIYTYCHTLSLLDALPILRRHLLRHCGAGRLAVVPARAAARAGGARSEEHTSGTPVTPENLVCRLLLEKKKEEGERTGASRPQRVMEEGW